MSAIIDKKPISKEYMALIKKFPLRPIRNDKELDEASELIGEIGIKGKSRLPDEQDYMEVLGKLVDDYEKQSPRIRKFMQKAQRHSSQEILQSFLDDHELSQSELARRIGCLPSVISDFITGKRGLSKTNALKLGEYFAVSAELFLR